MARALLPFLLVSVLLGLVQAAPRVLEVTPPVVRDQLGRPDFANQIQRTLEMKIADDSGLALMRANPDEPQYRLELELHRDHRFPSREAVRVRFDLPSGESRWLTMTLLPEQLDEDSSRNWLVRKISNTTLRQLKAEAMVLLQPRLDDDLSKNIVLLNAKERRLEVELLGKSPASRTSPIPPDHADKVLAKEKPVAERRQPGLTDKILNFMNSPLNRKKDLKAPLAEEPPRKLTPIDPFHAQKHKARSRQPAFPFPRSVLSGPPSLFLSPSLGRLETDPRDRFSFSTSFSFVEENFSGAQGPLVSLNWKGEVLRQHISFSTRLWRHLNISLDTGYGVRNSDGVQLELNHPSAPGGTTFLSKRNLDPGLLDSTLTLTLVHDMRSFIFRPFLHVKLPTGNKESLLSSGGRDAGAGASLEWTQNDWHLKSMFSITSPEDLDIFAPSQGSVATSGYITLSVGVGKTLNLFGGERVSMSLTGQQNPLRRLSSIDDLDKEIVTLAGLVEKDIRKGLTFQLEVFGGMTNASPKTGLLLGLRQQF